MKKVRKSQAAIMVFIWVKHRFSLWVSLRKKNFWETYSLWRSWHGTNVILGLEYSVINQNISKWFKAITKSVAKKLAYKKVAVVV